MIDSFYSLLESNFSSSGRSVICRIPKGNGAHRLLYIPDESYRRDLKAASPAILAALDRHASDCADHAFQKGRNCVTNAQAHVGKRFTLSLDLTDFFDSINPSLIAPALDPALVELVTEDRAPRQGLPTSPWVSNLAMLEADKRLRLLCAGLGSVSFTRYADDLTFGFSDRAMAPIIHGAAKAILSSYGLTINEAKTSIQSVKNGSMVITGVSVTPHGVHPTRKTLRRIRAALHQNNAPQLKGLREWAMCKLPKGISN